MMKFAVLIACVALTLQVEARHAVPRGTDDNEVQIPEFKVKAPWNGQEDEGYPKFDGNPFKQSLVDLTSMIAYIAADALEDEPNVPLAVKSIIKSAQKTNWNTFDEYLNFWGSAQIALMKEIDASQSHASIDSFEDESKGRFF